MLEEGILMEVKRRAVMENRALADVIQDALGFYLHEDIELVDAVRACDKFCSHGRSLDRSEIEELLLEDMLTP